MASHVAIRLKTSSRIKAGQDKGGKVSQNQAIEGSETAPAPTVKAGLIVVIFGLLFSKTRSHSEA